MERATSNGRLRQTSVRLVAMLAIAAALVALVLVVGGSLDSSEDGDRAERRSEQREQREQRPQDPGEDFYVVQPNDTLAGIAERTGVPVDELQSLNPDIDPQALPSGAQLKLR